LTSRQLERTSGEKEHITAKKGVAERGPPLRGLNPAKHPRTISEIEEGRVVAKQEIPGGHCKMKGEFSW